MSNENSERKKYLKVLKSIDTDVLHEISSFGASTHFNEEGVSMNYGGDKQIIGQTIALTQEISDIVKASIENQTEDVCPDDWDECEWREAVNMVKSNCLLGIEYHSVHMEWGCDEVKYFLKERDAEKEAFSRIGENLESQGGLSFERWEDMNTTELKYWYERYLEILKEEES